MMLPTAVLFSCSAPCGRGSDAGAADDYRPVGGSVTATPIVPSQDQNRLPYGDGVEPVDVRLSRPEGGAEVTGTLSFPDCGGDLVRIHGRPEEAQQSSFKYKETTQLWTMPTLLLHLELCKPKVAQLKKQNKKTQCNSMSQQWTINWANIVNTSGRDFSHITSCDMRFYENYGLCAWAHLHSSIELCRFFVVVVVKNSN